MVETWSQVCPKATRINAFVDLENGLVDSRLAGVDYEIYDQNAEKSNHVGVARGA